MATNADKKYLDYGGLVKVFDIIKSNIEEKIDGVNSTIEGLDFKGVAQGNTVVTQVTQTDGKVEATGGVISSRNNTIVVEGLELDVNIDGETIVKDGSTGKLSVAPSATAVSGKEAIVVGAASEGGKEVSLNIAEGEKVLSQDEDGLKSTITITKETTGLDSNVQEQYKLVGKDGVALGETIKIYKDSALQNVELSGQTLVFTYILADGSTKTQDVDISLFLSEEEYEDGLQVVGGKVSVKKATDSEDFLVVDEDGVAITGVQDAIDTAKADAISELKGTATTNGDTLGKLEDRVKKVEDLVGTDSVADQIDTAISAAIDELDAEVTSTDGTFVTVKVTEVDGKITAVNVTENNIASADALNAEITARKAVDGQNGQTYAANTTTNYISSATSLNDADVKLDAQIKAVADSAISVAEGNGITITESGTTKTISVKKASVSDETDYLTVDANGVKVSGIDAAIEAAYAKITSLSDNDIDAAWDEATGTGD